MYKDTHKLNVCLYNFYKLFYSLYEIIFICSPYKYSILFCIWYNKFFSSSDVLLLSIAALLSGGIRMMVAYAANIALISLGYLYMVNNKKNEILP